MANNKILTINPGSTSMKIALFQDKEELFLENLEIPTETLKSFASMADQYVYRKEMILDQMKQHGYEMADVDMFLARGAMEASPAGIFAVNDKLMKMNDLSLPTTVPQSMGCLFVHDFEAEFGGKGYVINEGAIDEFEDVARVTGVKGLWRMPHAHSLNQKAAGQKAAEEEGKAYEDLNMVIAHLGGGITIGAHRKGRIIDTSNLMGEGPMTPNRSGALPVGTILIDIMYGKTDAKTIMKKVMTSSGGGGLTGHLGTADGRQIEKMIAGGDKYAKLIYDGMIYQISQTIARMAASLEGKVDYIVMTGGLSNSTYIQDGVKKYCGWIAPVKVFAGEYETEAMVNAAVRVLSGQDDVKEYTGLPVFDLSKYEK